MLQELTYHIMQQSQTWWTTDHLGTVGAALCWQHRRNGESTSASHANRLVQTSTAQWDKDLRQLEKHGFLIFGYHKQDTRMKDSTELALQPLADGA